MKTHNLNEAQERAVSCIDGPMLVLAGPGTGKTQILAHRVAQILESTDMSPNNILCLTFTDAASDNMTERISKIIGASGYEVAVHTFHSFARMAFNRFPEYFYNGANFQPASEIEKLEILNDILRELPYDNPLSGTKDDIAINLKIVKSAISSTKRKGALTSDELTNIANKNIDFIDFVEPILAKTFADKISQKNLSVYKAGYEQLEKFHDEDNTLAIQIINDFADAVNTAIETDKTNAVTAFKNQYFNAKLGLMLDRKRSEKTLALAGVYENYQAELNKRSLQDFDDMIVQIVEKLETNAELRANLQEHYQYVLVDEFQDTNDAQLRILFSLADSPDSNIMAVGDDDQAIYSFQGANVNNLKEFERHYPNCQKIQLYENYRSEEKILQLAETTISGAETRVKQGFFEHLSKLASKKIHEDGEKVEFIEAENEVDEMAWIAQNVKSEISSMDTREIAVIAKEHKDLLRLIPYLNNQGVNNIEYDQKLDALDGEVVRTLETLARIVVYLGDSAMKKANELMPDLLAHPAWQIPTKEVWQLSLKTEYDGRWLESIDDSTSTSGALLELRDFLIDMSIKTKNMTLENALDELFDYAYKEYYFSQQKVAENPEEYINFLTDLVALREALREYKTETPKLKDFIEFLDLSRKYGQKITTLRQYGNEAKVHLMSAHSSKGLEFDSVYVINGSKKRWLTSKSDGFFPGNLRLAPSANNDENLRLIFVAITRAKHRLFISTARKTSKKGENLTILPTLGDIPIKQAHTNSTPLEKIQIAWNKKYTEVNQDLRDVLATRLASYKLNATALNSFTNLKYAGPKKFLLNNLLKFPSAKSPSADYGTAIHETIKFASTFFMKKSSKPEASEIKKVFESQLKRMHMLEVDYNYFLKKGFDYLPRFVESFDFNKHQHVEQVFDATLDDMRLTGKLDLVEIDEKNKVINVIDFKTGNGFDEFNKKEIKSHTYWQQLMFYKLLVEKSSNRPGYKVGSVSLYFIEADADRTATLEIDFSRYDAGEFIKLLHSVWGHIMKLDFPDVSDYKQTLSGTLDFEQDLLHGKK